MTAFIVICILLMVWVMIIAPFIKLIRVSRSWKQAAERARNAYGRQQQRAPQQAPKPKKKIDPTVGEYVEFTETTTTRTATDPTTGTTTHTTETESQITDITWEDLP